MSGIFDSTKMPLQWWMPTAVAALLPGKILSAFCQYVLGTPHQNDFSFKLFGATVTLSIGAEPPANVWMTCVRLGRVLAEIDCFYLCVRRMARKKHEETEFFDPRFWDTFCFWSVCVSAENERSATGLGKLIIYPFMLLELCVTIHLMDRMGQYVFSKGYTRCHQARRWLLFRYRWLRQTATRTIGNADFETGAQCETQPAYQPLEIREAQIRLVTAAGVGSDGILDVNIKVVSLYDEPHYTAASFRWATADAFESVRVNGRPMHINQSAASLLHSSVMQQRIRESPFWIDSVSINQHDLHEKSHQVHLMKDIYEHAASVLIWLREPDVETDLALKQMLLLTKALSAQKDPYREGGVTKVFPGLRNMRERQLLLGIEGRDNTEAETRWAAVLNVLKDSYFTRTWVLQETSCANSTKVEIMLGLGGETVTYEISLWVVLLMFHMLGGINEILLENLSNGAQLLQQLQDSTHHQFIARKLRDQRRRRAWHAAHPVRQSLIRLLEGRSVIESDHEMWTQDFMNAMSWFRHFGATDPADKIFVPVGLVLGQKYPYIAADYRLSMTTIYSRVVETAIQVQGDLSILGQIGIPSDDLPTWIPDWRKAKSMTSLSEMRDAADRCVFSAGRALTLDVMVKPTEIEMVVYGVVVDTLKDTDIVMHTATMDVSHDLGIFKKLVGARITSSVTPSEHTFRRAYIADCLQKSSLNPMTNSWVDGRKFAGLRELCIKALRLPYKIDLYTFMSFDRAAHYYQRFHEYAEYAGSALPEQDTLNSDLVAHIKAMHVDRVIRMTVSGKLLLCPQRAATNDLVVVLAGGNVPMILRRTEPGNSGESSQYERYKLVGEAYVDGIMDGEIAQNVREDKSRLSTFVLV